MRVQQGAKGGGMHGCVVDSVDECVFKRDALLGDGNVLATGRQQLWEWKAVVDGHDGAAGIVGSSMQTDSKPHRRALSCKAEDLGH